MVTQGKRRQPAVAMDDHGKSSLTVVYRLITELILNPKNPRIHTKHQIFQIANSIRAFGFCVPILLRHNNVVGGHGRVLAAQMLGLRMVPTINLDHLTEDQARAFMIADNKLIENASWDEPLLGEQLKALAEVKLDFDLEVTGFEMGEIDLLIEGLAPASPGATDPADTLPEPGPRVSKPGDLWLLGRHRVYCGSALDPAAFEKVINGKQAAMVFADPPYNVPIDGHVSGLGRIKHKNFLEACGELSEREFTAFLLQACTHMADSSVDGSIHFIWMDWRHATELLTAGRQVYSELKNVCVWAKDTAGMGSLYRSAHEFVFVFKRGKARHVNNVQLGQFGRHRTNVWHYPGPHSLAPTSDEGNLLALHPTVKPVALVSDAILDCSRRGDIVLDAFLGSGTTVMAAERTGRICYGIELDPQYVDVIIRRYQAYTGDHARHAVSGKLFDQLAAKGGTSHAQTLRQ